MRREDISAVRFATPNAMFSSLPLGFEVFGWLHYLECVHYSCGCCALLIQNHCDRCMGKGDVTTGTCTALRGLSCNQCTAPCHGRTITNERTPCAILKHKINHKVTVQFFFHDHKSVHAQGIHQHAIASWFFNACNRSAREGVDLSSI